MSARREWVLRSGSIAEHLVLPVVSAVRAHRGVAGHSVARRKSINPSFKGTGAGERDRGRRHRVTEVARIRTGITELVRMVGGAARDAGVDRPAAHLVAGTQVGQLAIIPRTPSDRIASIFRACAHPRQQGDQPSTSMDASVNSRCTLRKRAAMPGRDENRKFTDRTGFRNRPTAARSQFVSQRSISQSCARYPPTDANSRPPGAR